MLKLTKRRERLEAYSVNELLGGKNCLKPLAKTMIKLQLYKGIKENIRKQKKIQRNKYLLLRKWIFTDEKEWIKSTIKIFCQKLIF